MSGGIRDDASLAAAMATGCARVNLGTAALEDPEWTRTAIGEYGDRVAVGLDVRGTTLAARGWTKEGGDLWETLAAWTPTGAPGTSSPMSPRTARCAVPTSTCCARSVPGPIGRSSRAAASRAWPTWRCCGPWSASGSRQPSSARPCTPGRSPSSGRSKWRAGRRAGRPRDDPAREAFRRDRVSVSTGAPWEAVFGYSRAVAVTGRGTHVVVAGTTATVNGVVQHRGTPTADPGGHRHHRRSADPGGRHPGARDQDPAVRRRPGPRLRGGAGPRRAFSWTSGPRRPSWW